MRFTRHLLPLVVMVVAITACGESGPEESSAAAERPVIVATTSVLGDVLEHLASDQFDIVTIMPAGADPHDFQPSAQDVAAIEDADAIIINGGGFEEGLLDAVEAAEADGAFVFEAITAVSTLNAAPGSHDHHDDHGDDDHGDEDDHDEDHANEDDHDEDHADEDHDDHGDGERVDPHFFTDPARMAVAAEGIVDVLVANVEGIDEAALRAQANGYIAKLAELDQEVETSLASIAAEDRVLVTNHDVYDYFADRYDFEIAGTVIPTGSDAQGVSGQRIVELAEVLETEGVSVVFVDSSASSDLARTVADEAGDVVIVELFSESLGGADSGGTTYIDMVRANASAIAEALGG